MRETHGQISVVVGGQFGSEGKGAVAGWISRPAANAGREVLGVRVGGPNAGHTVYGRCPNVVARSMDGYTQIVDCEKCNEFGHPWALRQVPVAAVTNPEAGLVIAAGSEVDPDVLMAEVRELDAAGYRVTDRLVVDSAATLLMESHRAWERGKQLQARLGSTAKGIGAARADRIFREAFTVGQPNPTFDFNLLGVERAPLTVDLMERCLAEDGHVVIEGTQGFGLGLHTPFYPFTTSGDCRAIDFLAQAGLSPWVRPSAMEDLPPQLRVVVCFRPHPIRVAGNSGPMKAETDWQALGLAQERTTVTQKVRRVGGWDPELVEEAIRANGGIGPHLVLALTMADHIFPGLRSQTEWLGLADQDLRAWLQSSNLEPRTVDHFWNGLGNGGALLGTGPTTMLGDILNLFWGRGALRPALGPRSSRETKGDPFAGSSRREEFAMANTSEKPEYQPLGEWWRRKSEEQLRMLLPKAAEYGSNSLQRVGEVLARTAGRVPTSAEALELGCYFYALGKMERWTDAVLRGEQPSTDTLEDLEVYCRMVRRIRETGDWPGKVEPHK